MNLTDIVDKLTEFQQILASIVRVGKVVSQVPQKGMVRVEFADLTANDRPLVSAELQVLYSKTHADKDYFLPDLGEQVICLFLPGGLQTGFVLGSVYSKADSVPVASSGKWHKTFQDGTVLEYDRSSHILKAEVKGEAMIKAENITASASGDISAKAANIKAAASGNIDAEASGTLKATAGSMATLTAPKIDLNAPTITLGGAVLVAGPLAMSPAPGGGGVSAKLQGDLEVKGSLKVNGNISATGKIEGASSDNHHIHPQYKEK